VDTGPRGRDNVAATDRTADRTAARRSTRLARDLPVLQWLPAYRRSWLRADLVAGLTAWAVMVPEAMAYAGIAGVPPLIGLYTVPLPLLAYALLGTSRTLVVGPDSATALLSAVTVAPLAAQGSDYLALTSALAMVVGALFLGFGLLRMGWIANFIPIPVMRGFIQGLVWVTIIWQIPKVLGIEEAQGRFVERLLEIAQRLPDANPATTLLGLGSLALLLLLRRFLPRLPAALVVTALAIALVATLGLGDRGVALVGTIEAGLPALSLPHVSLADLETIVPGALAIVLLGYAESLAAANAAAAVTGGEIDANQELLSHGPANLGSALCSGFVVVGSLSKTSVALAAGARTQVASLVNAGLVVLTLLFLMPLFQNLPYATLGAVVIAAMIGLLDIGYLRRLARISWPEFLIAMVALLGVLVLGVLQGIGLGIALSIGLLVYRASYPSTAELGRLPHEHAYRDVARRANARPIPGLLIFRFDGGLIFSSANQLRTDLRRRIARANPPIRAVLVDAEAIIVIDATALEVLENLRAELHRNGIALGFARVRDPVRDQMRRAGLEAAIGEDRFYETITDGVDAFTARQD
jgi:high affinity sulfate transporter 1